VSKTIRQAVSELSKAVSYLELVAKIEVLEHEVDMWRKHVPELEAAIRRVRDVGFDVHPSWGSSDDFYRGWKACRKQIEEALGEMK